MVLLGACTDSTPVLDSGAGACHSVATPIAAIQGSGYQSPLLGSLQTVHGTVTFIDPGSGFYLEDEMSAPIPGSSSALFVSDRVLAGAVETGQLVELNGRVSELGKHKDTLTALVDVTGLEICGGDAALPLTPVRLPMNSKAREALEGMRVSLEQALTVTDVYNLARGELTLTSSGVLRVPTEAVNPGSKARDLERSNQNHSLTALLPVSGAAFPVGASTRSASGVLGHNSRGQQLFLDSTLAMEFDRPGLLPQAGENTIRVVNSNLLNFFNGDGTGGGFPTERGAATADEFLAQTARTRAAMEQIQPDLLAVQELENDGFGSRSAAQSLLDLLNNTGHDDWAFISAGGEGIGGDVITVGLFYRQQVLQAIGPARLLDGSEFRGLSRQPLAQLFRDSRTGQTFLVAVNHLKSKGRCPDSGENSDREDGQGCWNPARVAAVVAQIPWLEGLARDAGTGKILVLGDMNAWRNEDPIRQFADSGFIDLVELRSGLPQHSFLYWGQTGTLDYAFATPALVNDVKAAMIWNVNANWPAGMELPLPWLRASDHDPVIVDLEFNQTATSD